MSLVHAILSQLICDISGPGHGPLSQNISPFCLMYIRTKSTSMFKKLAIVFALVIGIQFVSHQALAQDKGAVKGKIIEQSTKRPLAGATVSIKDYPFSVSTDSSGTFTLSNIPLGNYTLLITNIGFQPKTLTDIPVAPGKAYYLETELLQDAIQLGAVSVRAYRGENNPMVPVSSFSFSREEIFKSPGAQGDIFRAIGILPGVVSSGGQYSAIAVRGQGTSDNVYMADDIPLFQVSHLEFEGFNAGFNDPNGGRFSIFAPRVVENATFQGGGFAAQYGRKSSSYLGLGIKEGNRTNPFYSGQFDLLGFTLIYDGPSGKDQHGAQCEEQADLHRYVQSRKIYQGYRQCAGRQEHR